MRWWAVHWLTLQTGIWLLAAVLLLRAGNATTQEVEKYNPALACDPSRARCLLVIERFDVSPGPTDGSLVGTSSAENSVISDVVGSNQMRPSVTYDPVRGRFLVV